MQFDKKTTLQDLLYNITKIVNKNEMVYLIYLLHLVLKQMT